MDEVEDRACRDAERLESGGFDAVLIENFGDVPFFPDRNPSVTIAAMARIAASLTRHLTVPTGVNLLRNDADGALAICAAAELDFLRVNVHTGTMFTDQGVITGRAHETLRTRATLAPEAAILADVFVKHATPPPGAVLEEVAKDCWSRALPDAVVVTGTGTGAQTSADHLRRVKAAIPEAPVYIGSGLTPESVELLREADGALVGSSVKVGGAAGSEVDSERVARLMEAIASSPRLEAKASP